MTEVAAMLDKRGPAPFCGRSALLPVFLAGGCCEAVLLQGTAGSERATPVARERAPTGAFADHAEARAAGAK